MDPLVPVPNFEFIAQILKDADLFDVTNRSIDLVRVIKTSTMLDPLWDGYIGNMFVGGAQRPNARYLDWDFRLWSPWRWTLIAYANAMSDECRKRGLPAKRVPPDYGNFCLSGLQAADERLADRWPECRDRYVPYWLNDARLGRQHRAALVAHDVYYHQFWPYENYDEIS